MNENVTDINIQLWNLRMFQMLPRLACQQSDDPIEGSQLVATLQRTKGDRIDAMRLTSRRYI